jgi:hypothetical protein
LVVQVQSAWEATRADWTRPFSGALETANYLSKRYPDGTLFIGSNDFIASGVAGYMDRSILFADTGDFGESVVSHNRRYAVSESSLLDLARSNLPGRRHVVLILHFPLTARDPTLEVSSQYVSPAGPIVGDERYWIYEVRPAPPRPVTHH